MASIVPARIAVAYNRDFEEATSDPENKAREDIIDIAQHIVHILNEHGYQACAVGVTGDVLDSMARLRDWKPSAVFNLCESIKGDNRYECLLPLLLELEGLPHTGSPAFALSLALRKEMVKDVLAARGVPVPRGEVVRSVPELEKLALGFPLIVKPAREDASVGISSASVVHDRAALADRVAHVLAHYRQPALVEEFIEGREIYVSLLGRVGDEPQVLPLHEIDFTDMPIDRPKIVSFEAKWIEESLEYKGTKPVLCTGLPDEVLERVHTVARQAFRTIGLRDYGRVDVRLHANGTPYVIDVNPNCDLSHVAGGYARAVRAAGLSYEDLVLRLVALALSRGPNAGAGRLAQAI
jgi:D-alanine-D-alanine ligase